MADNDKNIRSWRWTLITVQIPLWPIMTQGQLRHIIKKASSDSSMADNDSLSITVSFLLYTCSDSSMADNDCTASAQIWSISNVQIPLWPIMTTIEHLDEAGCNKFRFLYGR